MNGPSWGDRFDKDAEFLQTRIRPDAHANDAYA